MDDFDLNEWLNTEYRRQYNSALAQARAMGARDVEPVGLSTQGATDEGGIRYFFEWRPIP